MKFIRTRYLHSIRGQLIASFILMALLPALGISIGSVWGGYINGRQQAFDRLESASSLKQIEIERWLDVIKNDADTALTEEYAYDRILTALTLATDNRYFRFYNGAIRNRFEILISQSNKLDELILLDTQGKVLISTDTELEGSDLSEMEGFQRTQKEPTFQLYFTDDQEVTIFVYIPVFDLSSQLVGVIVARSKPNQIVDILQDTTGLGSSGYAYLVYPDATVVNASDITDSLQSNSYRLQQAHSKGINTLLSEHTTLTGIFLDTENQRVLGVYRWLPSLQMGLIIEQDLVDAFSIVFSSLTVTIVVALASLALGILAALLLTRYIAQPLTLLADAAHHIQGDGLSPGDFSSGGYLEQVQIDRPDEIGALARAFNAMTSQLGSLINQLEQRVAERTSELEDANRALNRRALQVDTSFKVGRQITSILELQPLLQKIVDLIRQSFGYEQVMIYLLEKENNQLALQASSPVLQDARYATLPLENNSLNGSGAVLNHPIVINDIHQDQRFLSMDPLNVSSEMVIPLTIADDVIGTLDIQSVQLNAFSDEDVLGFQNLADQIAIAIQNARLYAGSRELAVLQERNRLSRELHDSVIQSLYSLNLLAGGWQRLLETDQQVEIKEYLQKVREISDRALREMRLLVYQLRPPILADVGLLDALHQRLDAVEKRAGIQTRLVGEDLLEVPAELEEPFYWIAQEALNNAIKHGSPEAISIHLCCEDAKIVMEIGDDGCGFDLQKALHSGGMGLRNMKERAEEIHAGFIVQTAPGQGTVIRVLAPYNREVGDGKDQNSHL